MEQFAAISNCKSSHVGRRSAQSGLKVSAPHDLTLSAHDFDLAKAAASRLALKGQ
jgi:hypothetical protein